DLLFFFFSSRRRHTRSKRDWSSDVCSSDLAVRAARRVKCCWQACGEPNPIASAICAQVRPALRARNSRPDSTPSTSARAAGSREIGRASCRERVETRGAGGREAKKEEVATE